MLRKFYRAIDDHDEVKNGQNNTIGVKRININKTELQFA